MWRDVVSLLQSADQRESGNEIVGTGGLSWVLMRRSGARPWQ
jgi:hypothetical protein